MTNDKKKYIIILNKKKKKMKTNKSTQKNQKMPTTLNQNKNQMKNQTQKNNSRALPFYITIVSVTAIFALLVIFLIEKHENFKCVNSGLIQKVEDGKVIWTNRD